jgi:hypothetical protein
MMPEAMDAEGKRFSPPPGKANLYVTRTTFLAGAVLFQVHLDGRLAGSIAPNTYLLLDVDPGKHQVLVTTPESQNAVTVNVNAGDNHFFEVTPAMGWMHARAEIQPLPEDEGKKAVQGSKRADVILFRP